MAGLPDPEGGGDAEADPSRACHVFPPLLHETETRYKDFESKIFESCEPRNISNPTFGPETADPRKNRFDSRNIRFMNPCPSVSRPRPAAIVRTVLDVPGPQRLIPRTAPPGVIRLRRLPDRGPDHCCEKKKAVRLPAAEGVPEALRKDPDRRTLRDSKSLSDFESIASRFESFRSKVESDSSGCESY